MAAPVVFRELETRQHELRKSRVVRVDGNLTANLDTVQRGLSARAYLEGYWGFASAPMAAGEASATSACERVQQQALADARAMARFGTRESLPLPLRR